MAKVKDSINNSIFFALKNSETSGVNTLLVGQAGVGKSTTVQMFCDLRGYHMVTLRGATMSESECMGFDCVHNTEAGVTIKHCRPSWFEEIMECEKKGKKVLLFVDEILTANSFVQAALLNLIFDRKCDSEPLPDSTLIVAAGNYINNLTSDFQTIAPLWNRFCIFNVTADENALDEFLSVYDGALNGKRKKLMDIKKESLDKMDSQAVKVPEEQKDKICQYFEMAVRETTRQLMKTGEKPLDLNCTETQSIYASQDGDEFMRGFVSLRTLGYLVRETCATYFNFGKEGIKSDNFKKIVEGLVGISLSRKNGQAVKTKTADNYYQSIVQTLANIDKLSNSKIMAYEEFFTKLLDKIGKSELDQNVITAILDKFSEMANDTEVKDVVKPLDDGVITKLCDLVQYSSRKSITIKIQPDGDMKDALTTEKCTGMVSKWNYLSEIFGNIQTLTKDKNKTYPKAVLDSVKSAKEKLQEDYMRLSSYVRLTKNNHPGFDGLVPDIKKLKD